MLCLILICFMFNGLFSGAFGCLLLIVDVCCTRFV